jgi:hypothetical protein
MHILNWLWQAFKYYFMKKIDLTDEEGKQLLEQFSEERDIVITRGITDIEISLSFSESIGWGTLRVGDYGAVFVNAEEFRLMKEKYRIRDK